MQNIHADFNQDINKIDISIEVAEVLIEKGSKFSVNVTGAHTDSFKTVDVIDHTLTVVQKIRKWAHPFEWISHSGPVLKITVPGNFEAEEIKLVLNVGSLAVKEIKSKTFDICTKVGDFEGNGLTAENALIKSNVGKIGIKNSYFSNSTITSETGEVEIDGYLKGDSKIKTSVGEVRLNLDEFSHSCYITTNTTVGQVTYNGERITEPLGKRNAENAINISTTVGEIKIKRKE